MPTATLSHKDSVHGSILEWSLKRPNWQRDALRRLVESESLTTADIAEIVALCSAEHGLLASGEESPTAKPLARSHLPAAEIAGQDVSLDAICSVKHVNALAENQVFTFGSQGLTVVYGDNGAGKTGYSRILKRACRARNRGDRIKPNIYKPVPKQPASATLKFNMSGTAQEVEWLDGDTGPAELSAVSFFDSHCAVAHVNAANDIAFTPFGLDLLERLVGVCDQVKHKLTDDKQRLEKEKPSALLKPMVAATTTVGKVIAQLNAKTDKETLASLANLTVTEQERRQQIQTDLATDPIKAADQLKARIRRLNGLLETIKSATRALSDEAITATQRLFEDFAAKQAAARIAATTLFSDEPLPDIGGAAWRALWDAARRYSDAAAYPEQAFPVLAPGSRCVLCQQELSEEASDRIGRFDQFVKDNADKAARDAEARCTQARQAFEQVGLTPTVYRDILNEIAVDDLNLARRLRQNIIELRWRRRSVLRAISDLDWQPAHPLSPSTHEDFARWISGLTERETALRQSVDPKLRAALQVELQELNDRVWLNANLDFVLEEITRLGKLDQINAAIKGTTPTQITVKSKMLAEEHVTTRLRAQFADEIERLHIGKVKVELQLAGSEKGSSRYQIRFISAPTESLAGILSEGEHRAIALAGFLTELATSPTKSALVFDDPVSSLDHHWRNSVAKRLVEEAAQRQVIVFTHDLIFLHDLLDCAQDVGVEHHLQRVYISPVGTGTISDSLPWKAQNTIDRIDRLGKKARSARSLYEANDEDRYAKETIDIYGELRATIERAIEEHLFARVIFRYRDYIDLKNLRKVAIAETSDCNLLLSLFEKCCGITNAHDPSMARNASIPVPTAMLDDIEQLSQWVRQYKTRQNAVS